MRWEYWVEQVEIFERWSKKRQAAEMAVFLERLNQLGQDQWEMIGLQTVPLTGAFSNNINGYVHLTMFKRQVAA